jgi:hypothetical protein
VSLFLTACPQLLDDDFSSRLPDLSPGTGGVAGAPGVDAGPELGGGPSDASQGGSAGMPPLTPAVAALRASLVHRYSFSGTGAIAVDSIGDADAPLIGTELDDRGTLVLSGDGAFASLPNGLLPASNNCTIEAWLTWRGGDDWQRIFDFGSSSAGEAARGTGATYLFLTPRSLDGVMVLGFSTRGIAGETVLSATRALPIGELVHVAAVIDSETDRFSLHLNGALDASGVLEERLSGIEDVNVWIGLGQFEADPSLDADISEFRIFDRALSQNELRLSYDLGLDESWLAAP